MTLDFFCLRVLVCYLLVRIPTNNGELISTIREFVIHLPLFLHVAECMLRPSESILHYNQSLFLDFMVDCNSSITHVQWYTPVHKDSLRTLLNWREYEQLRSYFMFNDTLSHCHNNKMNFSIKITMTKEVDILLDGVLEAHAHGSQEINSSSCDSSAPAKYNITSENETALDCKTCSTYMTTMATQTVPDTSFLQNGKLYI